MPPFHYDQKQLETLEEQKQVYLAICIQCEEQKLEQQNWLCNGCQKSKKLNQFSIARRRTKNKMYCLECDFPRCTKCKERATVCVNQKQQHGKKEPYMCDKCLYPPCPKCGKERPHQKDYNVKTLKTWTCKSCRYGTEGKVSPTLRYFKTKNLKIYFLIRTSCFGYRSK